MLVYKGQQKIYSHEDVEKLKRLIENDYDENTASSGQSSFSFKLEKYLISSGASDILDLGNCVITLILNIFYIISTYTTSKTASNISINNTIDNIEIFLCVFLIAHFTLKVYVSQNRLIFLFTFDSLIDFGTIIPILLAKQTFVDEELKYFLKLLYDVY